VLFTPLILGRGPVRNREGGLKASTSCLLEGGEGNKKKGKGAKTRGGRVALILQGGGMEGNYYLSADHTGKK